MREIWKQFVAFVSGKKAPGKIYSWALRLLALGWLYCVLYTNVDFNFLAVFGVFTAFFGMTFQTQFLKRFFGGQNKK